MLNSCSESYKRAGVDLTAGYRAVQLMQQHIARTRTPGVLTEIGDFGGLFSLDISNIREPVLVSGTDGVGTKLKLAFLLEKNDTIGIDCVAMCVNDVICCGARPLYFLDYIALGKNQPQRTAEIVSGVAEGCVQAGCALIGGETAEMPGFYATDEYDLAGFCTGVVEKSKIIDKKRIELGDVLIALPSSGLHSNGFSLVRQVFRINKENLGMYVEELGETLGETLLRPTKIYVKSILSLIDTLDVHGIAHITGGGFYENIPRMLPPGHMAKIDKSSIKIPPIFSLLHKTFEIPEKDMYNTYNMGVGMCVAVAENDVARALETLHQSGEEAYVLGEIVSGEEGVLLS